MSGVYIGETKRCLENRLKEHKNNSNSMTAVTLHKRRSKRGREEPSTPGFFHHVRTTYCYHTGKLLKKWSHFTEDLTLASSQRYLLLR